MQKYNTLCWERLNRRVNTRQPRQADKAGFECQLRPQSCMTLDKSHSFSGTQVVFFFILFCLKNGNNAPYPA